jgi:hypothetical protein
MQWSSSFEKLKSPNISEENLLSEYIAKLSEIYKIPNF